jgi:hypothetical protein
VSIHTPSRIADRESIRGRANHAAPFWLATIAVLAIPWLIPLDYVFVQPVVRLVYVATLAAGAVLFFFLPAQTPDRRWVLLFGLLTVVACTFAVTSFGSTGTVLLVLRVLSGFALFRLVRNPTVVLALVVMFGTASLAVDYVLEDFAYLRLFDGLRFAPNTEVSLRPRGFVGQAVPAGILAIVASVALAAAHSTQGRGAARAVVMIAAGVGASLLSGTRSALIVLAALGVLALGRHLGLGRIAFGRIIAFAVVGLLAAGTVLTLGRDLPIFARGPLENSASLVVRSNALAVLERLPNPCGPPCTIAGHGFGSLQEILRQGFGFRYINTVDNQFVSMFWDFGIVGLMAIAVLTLAALRAALRETDPVRAAGAFGVVGLVLGGMFYDVFWNSHGTLLLGLFIAMWVAPPREAASLGPPVARHGSTR